MSIDPGRLAPIVRGWHFTHVPLAEAVPDSPSWPAVKERLELARCRYVAVVLFGKGVRVFAPDPAALAAAAGEAHPVLAGAEDALLSRGDEIQLDELTAFDLTNQQPPGSP